MNLNMFFVVVFSVIVLLGIASILYENLWIVIAIVVLPMPVILLACLFTTKPSVNERTVAESIADYSPAPLNETQYPELYTDDTPDSTPRQ